MDRGTTQTLVMRGISANLIEHGSTNKTRQELALVLDDYQDVVNGIYEEILEGRSITHNAIRHLHQAFLAIVNREASRFTIGICIPRIAGK